MEDDVVADDGSTVDEITGIADKTGALRSTRGAVAVRVPVDDEPVVDGGDDEESSAPSFPALSATALAVSFGSDLCVAVCAGRARAATRVD